LFLDRLEQLIRHAQRNPSYNFAVLFLDLDRFKVVNDSLGHVLGDELLVAIAQRLQKCVFTGDTVARLGGDEFAILLDEVKDVNVATRVADRIEKALQAPFSLRGHEVFTAASVGIALSATGYTQPEDVLRDADTAMYRAKNSGHGSYEVFDRTMHSQAVEQLEIETDLRRALDRDEFVLHYQPIVSLETSDIDGFEALVRWQHPKSGLLMPADFIRVAEETGLIVPMGWIILRAACAQMNDWLRAFPFASRLTMSVNLSTRQFSQPDLVEQIDTILQETGCPPVNLKLEITESTVMQNAAQAADMLHQLRARGINLCIDDFGTGYSSLSYLNSFPVDTLKIDRSFISKIDEDSSTVDLIETIVALSRVLGMSAVAEGIETPEQLELVRRLGSPMAQGYYLSTPLTAAAAAVVLAEGLDF
jgi:diguanylate cyclase (GGDEF)-like protein